MEVATLDRGEAGIAHQRNSNAGRRLARAALLVFGAPLLLLLLGAGGAATLASDQPAWALAGLAPLLAIAVGGRTPLNALGLPSKARLLRQ